MDVGWMTSPLAQRARQFGAYLLVRSLICLIQAVSIETCDQVAWACAWLLNDVFGVRRRVVDENLALAYPDLTSGQRRHLARAMWRHLFLLVAEIAHVPRKIHDTNWRDYVRLRGQAELVRRLLADRPFLLISGHFGNFEVAGYVLGVLGFPTYSIARTLDNPYLNRFLNRFRGNTGQHIIPKKGGFEEMERVLEANGTLSFLADQYAGTKGCWVEFFGRPASAHKAIALLALEYDAPLAVGTSCRLQRPMQFELFCHAIADPRELTDQQADPRRLTQWFTTQLETAIRRAPGQYWWLHRRWRDRRPPGRKRRLAA